MAITGIDVLLSFAADTKNAVKGINEIDKGLSSVDKTIMAASTAVVGFGVALAKVSRDAFIEFNAQMANVNSVVLAGTEELSNMTEQVIQLTNSGLRSYASDTARVLYNVASAGIEVSKRMEVANTVLKVSAATLADQADVTKLVTGLMNSYGISAEKAGNLFVKTIQEGVTTGPELVAQMGRVASSAAAAGIKVEDLFSAVATSTKNFKSTDAAVTGLIGIISSFTGATDGAKKAAQELGFELSADAIKDFPEAMRKMYEATGGNIEKIGELIPNVRASSVALDLMKDSAKGFVEQSERMKDSSTALADALTRQENSAKAATDSFKQALNLLLIEMGKSVDEGFRPLTESATGFMQSFMAMDEELRRSFLGGNFVDALKSANQTFNELSESSFGKFIFGMMDNPLRKTTGLVTDLLTKLDVFSFKRQADVFYSDKEATEVDKRINQSKQLIEELQQKRSLERKDLTDLILAYKTLRANVEEGSDKYKQYSAIISGLTTQVGLMIKAEKESEKQTKRQTSAINTVTNAKKEEVKQTKELTEEEKELIKLRALASGSAVPDVEGLDPEQETESWVKFFNIVNDMITETDEAIIRSGKLLTDEENFDLHQAGVTIGQKLEHTFQNITNVTDETITELTNNIRQFGYTVADTFGQIFGEDIGELFDDLTQGASASITAMRGDFSQLAIVIAQELAESVQEATEAFDGLVNGTLSASEASSEFIRVIPFIGDALAGITRGATDLLGVTIPEKLKYLSDEFTSFAQQAVTDAKSIIDNVAKELSDKLEDLNQDKKDLAKDAYERSKEYIEKLYSAEESAIKDSMALTEGKIARSKELIASLKEEIDKLNGQGYKQAQSAKFEGDVSTFAANVDPDFFRQGEGALAVSQEAAKMQLEGQLRTGEININQFYDELMKLSVQSAAYYREVFKRTSKDGEIINSVTLGYLKKAESAADDYFQMQKDNQKEILQNTINLEQQSINSNQNQIDAFQMQLDGFKSFQDSMISELEEQYKKPPDAFLIGLNSVDTKLGSLFSKSQSFMSELDSISSKVASTNQQIASTQQKMNQVQAAKTQLSSTPTTSKVKSVGSSSSDYGGIMPSVAKTGKSEAKTSVTPTEKGWFDEGGALGWLNPMNWFAEGGVTRGPSLAGEAGPEAVFTGKQMEQMYNFVLANTGSNGSNSGRINVNIGNITAVDPKEAAKIINNQIAKSIRNY